MLREFRSRNDEVAVTKFGTLHFVSNIQTVRGIRRTAESAQ